MADTYSNIYADHGFIKDSPNIASDFGSMGRSVLKDGILDGCSMSYDLNNGVQITAGHVIACGRVLHIPGGSFVTGGIPRNIYVHIDLDSSDPNGVARIVCSQETHDSSNANINLSDREYWALIGEVGSVQPVEITPIYSYGGSSGGMELLWKADNNTTGMNEGTIITPNMGNMSNYTRFYIVFTRDTASSSTAGKSVYGHGYYVPKASDPMYSMMISNYTDDSNAGYTDGIYYRTSFIVSDDNCHPNNYWTSYARGVTFFRNHSPECIRFGKGGRYALSSSKEDFRDYYMVPIAIFGVG